MSSLSNETADDDYRLAKFIDRLPTSLAATVRFLRQPYGRWLRIPSGLLLILGGLLFFLPILGIWMLPLGLLLLAEDLPVLRSWRSRILDWIERHRPEWLESPNDRT